MPAYVDLGTIHLPGSTNAPPASWGTQVRDNFETIVRPPRVRLRRTTNLAIPTGVHTPVAWTTLVRDVDYDGATPHWSSAAPARFFARRTGTHLVTTSCFFNLNGTGQRQIGIRVNGLGERVLGWYSIGSAGSFVGSTISGEVDLNSGDFVEVLAYQDSGANLDIVSVLLPFFAMRWIGPL